MCGIVAAFDKKANVNNDILLQFEDQSNRGTNGFGSIFFDETGEFGLVERATGQIKAIIDIKLRPAKQIIFHHRQPSSSKNKISQTHPIMIDAKNLKSKYLVVHNGVIHNSDELKEQHEAAFKYTYSTDKEDKGWNDDKKRMYNDSETLGYEIAMFIEGNTNSVEAAGSAAFIVARISRKTGRINRIYFGRNSSNPLHMASNGKTRISLSSEGKGDNIKEDILYSFTPSNYKITKKKMVVPTTIPMTKEEEKEAEAAEKRSKGLPVTTSYPSTTYKPKTEPEHIPSGRSYNWDEFPKESGVGISNPAIMDEMDAEDVEELLDAARLEIDGIADAINDSYSGEELYLIDTADSAIHIATCLAQAMDKARAAAEEHRLAVYQEEEEKTPLEKKA